METEHFDDEVIALCERRALPPRRMLAVLAIFAGYVEEAVHQLIQTVAAAPYVAPAEPEATPAPVITDPPAALPKPPGPRPVTPPRLDPGREARLQNVRKPAPKPDTGGRGQRECVACGEVKGHTAFNVGSTTCRKCNGKT